MREFFSVCSRAFFCSALETPFYRDESHASPSISVKKCNNPFTNLGEGGKLVPNPSYVGRDADFELIGRLLGKVLYDNCTYEFISNSGDEETQFLKNRVAPRVSFPGLAYARQCSFVVIVEFVKQNTRLKSI